MYIHVDSHRHNFQGLLHLYPNLEHKKRDIDICVIFIFIYVYTCI